MHMSLMSTCSSWRHTKLFWLWNLITLEWCSQMEWFKVKKKEVDAVDVRQDVFAELLKYIYTGTVSIEKISIWLVCYFCQYCNIDDLKQECEESLINNLTLNNRIEIFKRSNQIIVESLERKAIQYANDNNKAKDLSKKLLKLSVNHFHCKWQAISGVLNAFNFYFLNLNYHLICHPLLTHQLQHQNLIDCLFNFRTKFMDQNNEVN